MKERLFPNSRFFYVLFHETIIGTAWPDAPVPPSRLSRRHSKADASMQV
jgi:hypothetical protein